jgi:hypothetical protein
MSVCQVGRHAKDVPAALALSPGGGSPGELYRSRLSISPSQLQPKPYLMVVLLLRLGIFHLIRSKRIFPPNSSKTYTDAQKILQGPPTLREDPVRMLTWLNFHDTYITVSVPAQRSNQSNLRVGLP